MTCRVFLVGEGPTDIGDLVELPTYRAGREGFLQPILRQMVAGGVELDFFDGRKLTALKRLSRREPPHHLQTRKAAQALALASVLEADALVFACDVDKAHGATRAAERRRRLREIRDSVEAGFAHARETDPKAARVLTATAVPARMIEAWALADREALAALLDIDLAALDYRPPEELWGDEDGRVLPGGRGQALQGDHELLLGRGQLHHRVADVAAQVQVAPPRALAQRRLSNLMPRWTSSIACFVSWSAFTRWPPLSCAACSRERSALRRLSSAARIRGCGSAVTVGTSVPAARAAASANEVSFHGLRM